MRKVFILIMSFVIVVVIGCSQQAQQPNLSKDQARNYANELYNKQVFKQSAVEYRKYLDNYKLNEVEQANISFTIADIYFERLKDYENALSYYIRVKYVHPKEELRRSVDKKIVACLERLERPEDAKQTLHESTTLEPEKIQKKRPGAVVAVVGNREITQGDIDFELSQLHPSLKSQFSTKEKKLEFLNQYILTDLLYNSAKRQGLDKDAEVVEAAFQAKRNIMVQRYLQAEISNKVNIKPEDVELYYKANKEKYVEKDDDGKVKRQKTFQEVQNQVAQELVMEKQSQVYQELAQKFMRAEGVRIYDDKLK